MQKSSTLTYRDLVARLSDLERLAVPPLAGERCGSQTSYDRRSVYNAETGLYENWNANRDGDGYIRMEDGHQVVFEAEGPGCIWRIWSAWPGMGHVKIFLDGASEPVMDLPFLHLFGGVGLLDYNLPCLSMKLSRGHNRYIPIPYNRSCRILMEPDWGRFYHITYSTFPEGTVLPAFKGEREDDNRIALAEEDRELAFRGRCLPTSADTEITDVQVTVPAGGSLELASLPGNRAITGLHCLPDQRVRSEAETALRELALSIHWDGETGPSVWSPIGDFFGAAPGIQPYRALPVGMTDEFLYSHWFMPFARGAELRLQNDGEVERSLAFRIASRPLAQDADELLRFHAKWHRDAFVEKSMGNGRDIDWPILNVEGRGRFCGVALHVWNRWEIPAEPPSSWWYGRGGDKTIDWWWGEGDEKFFVDGEKFPSTFGTGSEDYIGYAWAAEPPFPIFDSPFACQPFTPIDGNGHTSVNRFHIADDIPFQRSFEGCIEKYKGNRWGERGENHCLYDTVAYFYLAPGQVDPYGPVSLADRVGYCREPGG